MGAAGWWSHLCPHVLPPSVLGPLAGGLATDALSVLLAPHALTNLSIHCSIVLFQRTVLYLSQCAPLSGSVESLVWRAAATSVHLFWLAALPPHMTY